jgi:hypothetical protein
MVPRLRGAVKACRLFLKGRRIKISGIDASSVFIVCVENHAKVSEKWTGRSRSLHR